MPSNKIIPTHQGGDIFIKRAFFDKNNQTQGLKPYFNYAIMSTVIQLGGAQVAYSIVIIYADQEEATQDAARFTAYGCNVSAIGSDGRDALELARLHRPDVLILDPFLPYLNGDEIADRLEQEGFDTMVKIAISDEKNDRMAERFLLNGGDLFLVRPLDYAYCLRRIEKFRLMRERKSCYDLEESPKRTAIRRLQIRLNMPISITGFLYLQESVLLAMEDPQALHQLTNVLYPYVALQFQTSGKNVERCIRNAVEKTFEEGDLAMLQRYFPHFLNNKNGKPNNKEFIGYLAELAKDQLLDFKA